MWQNQEASRLSTLLFVFPFHNINRKGNIPPTLQPASSDIVSPFSEDVMVQTALKPFLTITLDGLQFT